MDVRTDLDNLLLWLGQNRPAGARQYIEMRQKLVALFEFKGCPTAEDLADETLDRAARAILKPGFVNEGNPIAYLRGVARNVYLESLRRNRTVSHDAIPEFAETIANPPTDNFRVEHLHACLDRCLAKLPTDKRDLLLRYYKGNKSAKIDGRLQLAQELAIELNTLRLQIFRLRNIIRKCVEGCTQAAEMELPV